MSAKITKVKSQAPVLETECDLNKDPETEGFDMQAGQTWIYPTNYSFRDYQYSITQEALFKNTMVSLPTGLGKTFIAAVVMYNFYRWYPRGKIIFMAPTRPLVKQQVDACYNITAIPTEVTAELTGLKAQASRKDVWNEKRVFFVTPQVLQNDLNILHELGTKIKCLVFDEAHKAKGNHAYCEVIRKLVPTNAYFRVLALSATPGSTLNDVLEVIHNLLISHLEIRTDDSPDVIPYVFERSLETVLVPLGGKLQQVRDSYIQILEKYTRVLVQNKVIPGNCAALTKGKIFMTLKEYQAKNQNGRDRLYPDIMRNLNICITLYHAYELLIRHGLRGFLSFYEEHAEKPLLRGNIELQQIMADVRTYLGPAPNIQPLPDGTILDIPENTKFGHPKFYKLRDILVEHFNDPNNSRSRVIVFCEYRESVMEAFALLLQHRPLIRPRIFLGQGAISQRQQITVINSFRDGECNTLISTCIGEEGLDVGDVDLIVCFDINNRSPVRMVQRMGRTGRKRQGRVVILVTEGKEQQTLKECLIHKQNLANHILQSSALYKNMYKQNPRMVPNNITPECQKIFITIKSDNKPQKKKNVKIKDMFNSIPVKNYNSNLFEDIGASITSNRIPAKQEYWCKVNPLAVELNENQMDFSKKIGKLRVLQPTGEIGHSKNSEMLVSLLQFSESKKYNISMTQVPVMPSQLQQPLKNITSTNTLKQTDIRNMFSKASSGHTNLTPAVKDLDIVEEIDLDKHMLSIFSVEVTNYLMSDSEEAICKLCDNLFDCSQIRTTIEFDITSIFEPEISILDNCNTKNFEIFENFMKSETSKLSSPKICKEDNNNFIKPVTPSVNEYERTYMNFNDINGLKITPLKQPHNVQTVLKKCGITPDLNDSMFDNVSFTQIEKIPNLVAKSFVDAEFTQMKDKTSIEQESLSFFNISSMEDIFAEESPEAASQETIVYSPTDDIDKLRKTTSKGIIRKDERTSPILSSYEKVQQFKNRVHKKLFDSFTEISNVKSQERLLLSDDDLFDSPTKCTETSVISTASAPIKHSKLTTHEKDETQSRISIWDTKKKSTNETSNTNGKSDALIKLLEDDVSAFADLSMFGFDEPFEMPKKPTDTKPQETDTLDDFSKDLWFDFLYTNVEDTSDADKERGLNDKLNISPVLDKRKECYLPKENYCLSNSDLAENDKMATHTKAINSESYDCTEGLDNVNKRKRNENILLKTPEKPSHREIVDLTSSPEKSPVLPNRTRDRTHLNESKSDNEINNRKTPCKKSKLSLTNPQKCITKIDDFKTNCRSQEILNVTSESTSELLDLDGSFQFTFNTRKPSNKRPLSKLTTSSSGSGSPVITKKPKNANSCSSATPKSSKRVKPSVVISSDSDDDFQPKTAFNWIKPRPRNILQTKKTESTGKKSAENVSNYSQKRKRCRKKRFKDCEYLDIEAELEMDEHATSDSDKDSDNEDHDKFEESFVDDDTQNIANTTITHAQYLKSVRSPPVNRGMFKIPKKAPLCINVYSQLVEEGENTYINDSFCIDTEDEEESSLERSMSELDVAELVLETEEKKSKQNLQEFSEMPKQKRRRIMQIDSDSD